MSGLGELRRLEIIGDIPICAVQIEEEITLGKLYLYFRVNKDFTSGLSCYCCHIELDLYLSAAVINRLLSGQIFDRRIWCHV